MPTPQIDEETILKRYESLPSDLRDALIGIGTADMLYQAGRKAGLSIEQIGLLAQEVGLIILGFVPSANFVSDLKTSLGVNQEKAEEIAYEVNDRVFLPIRESLKRIHGASWADELTKPPVKFEGQKVSVPKPAPTLPEIKPEPKTLPEKEVAGIPPARPAPAKEPMIIRPMGVPAPPPMAKSVIPPELPSPAARPAAPYVAYEPLKKPGLEEKRLPPPSAPAPAINPTTFSLGIEPREKNLKTPFIPAARPQGIREGGGIKPPALPQIGKPGEDKLKPPTFITPKPFGVQGGGETKKIVVPPPRAFEQKITPPAPKPPVITTASKPSAPAPAKISVAESKPSGFDPYREPVE